MPFLMNVGSTKPGDRQRHSSCMTLGYNSVALSPLIHPHLPPTQPQTMLTMTCFNLYRPHPPTPFHPQSGHPPTLIEDDGSVASTPSDTDPQHFQDIINFNASSIHTTTGTHCDVTAVEHYDITRRDVEQVYFSPHCFGACFNKEFTYHGSATLLHPTAGLILESTDKCVLITSMHRAHHVQKSRGGKVASATLGSHPPMVCQSHPLNKHPGFWRSSQQLHMVHAASQSCPLTSAMDSRMRAFAIILGPNEPPSFLPCSPATYHFMLSARILRTWDGGVLQCITHTTKLTHGTLLKRSDWDE